MAELKKVSQKARNSAFLRWIYGNLTCFSQEHMQTFGYLAAMLPVVDELYDTDEEKVKALSTYRTFFNTEPQIGTMVDLMKQYLPMDGIAMKTLFTVGSLLPAVGIGILCKQVITKPLDWITFAVGFLLAAVMGCNLIASAIIAVFFALINFEIQTLKTARPAVAAASAGADDEEEEDI